MAGVQTTAWETEPTTPQRRAGGNYHASVCESTAETQSCVGDVMFRLYEGEIMTDWHGQFWEKENNNNNNNIVMAMYGTTWLLEISRKHLVKYMIV